MRKDQQKKETRQRVFYRGLTNQRDEYNKEALKKMGWKVMTVWECQLKSAVREKTLLEVEYWINHSYLERFKQKPFRIYDVEGASLPIVAEGYMKYGKPE